MEKVYYDACSIINETLKKKGVSYADFADAFGKNPKAMSGIFKRNTKYFDEDELDDISAYLGISKNVLMVNPVSIGDIVHGRKIRTPNKSMEHKYLLVKPIKKEEDVNEHLKKETVKAITASGYSYSVGKDGTVTAKVSTSCEELKVQLNKYATYCDEKDKEIAELKDQLESERAHGDFFEKRFREVENQNKLLEDELEKKTALVNELSSLNTSLKRQAESVDFSIARDLRDAVAERDKYKEMLLKILLEHYANEVG